MEQEDWIPVGLAVVGTVAVLAVMTFARMAVPYGSDESTGLRGDTVEIRTRAVYTDVC